MLINQMFQNISLLILDQKIRIHKSYPKILAITTPMVLFPAPGIPIKTIFFIKVFLPVYKIQIRCMHVYTASITTTTILTPAVQNLNVKMSWTDNLYSYIIKININFIKSILYLTYNIPYNCGKKVKIIMKKLFFI